MKILCDEIGKETSEAVPSRDGGDGNKAIFKKSRPVRKQHLGDRRPLSDVSSANIIRCNRQALRKQASESPPITSHAAAKLVQQVKLKRAQGGCLGTKSRRKT